MQERVISQANEELIQAYLKIVATDDYQDFGTLLTDDCTFSLMPIGYTFQGRQEVMTFVETAGNRRRHDDQSKVVIRNWFTDGDSLCVEYEHSLIINVLHIRSKIDGYCLVFHFREGKFDAVREYINPSRLPWVFFTVIVLRLFPLIVRWKARRSGVKST
ncbi:MAG TPA: nuclear transport factor 2 family protein [Ktedonobacteraceae bacterium]